MIEYKTLTHPRKMLTIFFQFFKNLINLKKKLSLKYEKDILENFFFCYYSEKNIRRLLIFKLDIKIKFFNNIKHL